MNLITMEAPTFFLLLDSNDNLLWHYTGKLPLKTQTFARSSIPALDLIKLSFSWNRNGNTFAVKSHHHKLAFQNNNKTKTKKKKGNGKTEKRKNYKQLNWSIISDNSKFVPEIFQGEKWREKQNKIKTRKIILHHFLQKWKLNGQQKITKHKKI